jgi:RND family efflux transporter MFP subunit
MNEQNPSMERGIRQEEREKPHDRQPEVAEVVRPRRKARLLILAIIALVVISAAFAIVKARRASTTATAPAAATTAPAAPAPIEVTTATAILRTAPQKVEVVGSLAADEEVIVAAQAEGELASLSVDFGSFVQQGQVIAQLDQRNAQLKVEQAQATLNQTLARLGMKEGEKFDPQQNADVRVVKSQLDWAKMDLDRSTRLVENGDISRSVYDQAVIAHRTAEARYQAATDLIRQQLALVEQQRAALALAKKEVGDTVVKAPISGAVKEKHASRGSYLQKNGKIVTIVRINPLRVRAEIPEASAGAVRTGQTTSFRVDSFPDRTFTARIVRIGPSLNEQTRALTIEAEVGNPGNLLRPGMFARSEVVVNPRASAVYVPAKGVQYVAGLSKVFVIENGQTVERIVKTGASEGDLIEILDGVQEGENVATSNLDKLGQGVAVRQ